MSYRDAWEAVETVVLGALSWLDDILSEHAKAVPLAIKRETMAAAALSLQLDMDHLLSKGPEHSVRRSVSETGRSARARSRCRCGILHGR